MAAKAPGPNLFADLKDYLNTTHKVLGIEVE